MKVNLCFCRHSLILLYYHIKNTQNIMAAEDTNSYFMSQNQILIKIKKVTKLPTSISRLTSIPKNNDDMENLLLHVRNKFATER